MFIRLGIINIVRQLGRSTLSLVSLVLAAVALTSSLTVQQGYPAEVYSNYRDWMSGEIMLYPTRFLSTPSDRGDLQLHRLPQNEFSTLTLFYPHLTREGFLAVEPPRLQPFQAEQVAYLKSHPQVIAVNPIYRMAGWLGAKPDSNRTVALRSLMVDDPLAKYIVEGETEPGTYANNEPTVWLNTKSARDKYQSLPAKVEITLPRILQAADGSLQIDPSNCTTHTLRVAGGYALPTRSVSWRDETGNDMAEQAFLDISEVWLTEATWRELWEDTADGVEPAALSYGIRVKDLSVLEALVGELQVGAEGWTFISVPNLKRVADRRAVLDHFERAPQQLWQHEGRLQTGIPLDMSRILAILIYANAGLLMAARMLTGMAERRKEIGVLKALGARQSDIMQMALSESVMLSIIGSTIGFLLVYLAALHQQVSNRLPWAEIVGQLAGNYGFVIGVTMIVGLVFGLVPAWKMSKLTVMEVLRS